MSDVILIASDGTPGSDGAVAVGIELARRRGARAAVLAVLEPLPPATYPEVGGVPQAYAMLETVGTEDLRRNVTEQLERLGASSDCDVSVRVGPSALTIATHARERSANLIVAGTGPRTAIERWLRSNTAERIVQVANMPVLLVPEGTREPPISAVVGIDFSDFSLRAARAALGVLVEPRRLHLVHVAWPPVEARALPSLSGFWKTYQEGATARLQALAVELRGVQRVQVESHVIDGDAGHVLVTLAERMNVELIAAGSHGRGFIGRVLMGSVSTKIIRGARCSVLIVPPEAAIALEADGSEGRQPN